MPEAARYSLTIPPRAKDVATARLFVATVARMFEMDEDTVADLKLATSELAAASISGGSGDGVEVTIEVDDRLRSLSVRPIPGRTTDDDRLNIDPIDVVVAVFPDTERDPESQSVTVALSSLQ